jgi:predicted dehydrogenase
MGGTARTPEQSVGIALVGAGWISRVYLEALGRVAGTWVVGVASRTRASAEKLAERSGAPVLVDYDELERLLGDPRVSVVCVNSTNHLHAEHTLAALRAGKDVVVEKPLCLSLSEADRMIEAAREAERGLAYAENLCFAPHYRHARDLISSGKLGRVLFARQSEKHDGPYSDWFYQVEEAGGGALLDMGCHSIECLRWLLGKPRIVRVSGDLATLRHQERTRLDDTAILRLELLDGTRLVSESSWSLQGGMESVLEVHGTEGTLQVDMLGEGGVRVWRPGEGWKVEHPDFVGLSGYPQELEHFLDAFARGVEPEETAQDGRAVLEIMLAGYRSAREGRPVELPFDPGPVDRPVDLWLDPS